MMAVPRSSPHSAACSVETRDATTDIESPLLSFDLTDEASAPLGSNWAAPTWTHPDWTRTNLGTVFGVAIDGVGNAFLAHTSVYNYGIPRDAVGALGGPGAIYQIDSATGAPSLFATLPQTLDPSIQPASEAWPGIGNIACSSGSACTSASLEPSYVLKALGVGDDLAHSSLRLSLGRWTTEEEVDTATKGIIKAVKHLRSMSPLYDLHNEGIVHRDFKPENVKVNAKGKPMILDFGIALMEDSNNTRVTQNLTMMGTPMYMAPEVLTGRPPRWLCS